MRPSLIVATCLVAAGFASGAPARAAAPPAGPPAPSAPLRDVMAQANYAIGLNIGQSLRRDGVDADEAAIMRGLRDGLAGASPAYSTDQMRAAMTLLQASVQASRQAKAAQAAQANKTQGDAFLKANAARPGVVTLPDGLQYQILQTGSGPIPKPEDTIVCNYRGTLIDGKEFDSSQAHGGPTSLGVTGVIKGWSEALQLMPVGSRWRLFVPAALAYGENGAGPDIGPNAVLIFDLELLSIQPRS